MLEYYDIWKKYVIVTIVDLLETAMSISTGGEFTIDKKKIDKRTKFS